MAVARDEEPQPLIGRLADPDAHAATHGPRDAIIGADPELLCGK
jgi:hypothetical protein